MQGGSDRRYYAQLIIFCIDILNTEPDLVEILDVVEIMHLASFDAVGARQHDLSVYCQIVEATAQCFLNKFNEAEQILKDAWYFAERFCPDMMERVERAMRSNKIA